MTDKTKNDNTLTESLTTAAFADMAVNEDLKHSILIVSLVINLIVLTTWIALQVTTQYDAQIAALIFTR